MKVRLKADNLQLWLTRNSVSRREFMRYTGFSSGYLSHLMTGKRQPGAAARAAIYEETDLDWDELFEIVRTVEVPV